MRFAKMQSEIFHDIFALIASIALLLVTGCGNGEESFTSEIDLAPFQEMAMGANCADTVNRLYLIDSDLVFWDREGNCPDNGYSYTLFIDTVDDVLCSEHDAIGGPVRSCQDDFYSELFDEIIANLDTPGLGIGSEYEVVEISF